MSTLTAQQEERVTRAIEWALTQPDKTGQASAARASRDERNVGGTGIPASGCVSVPRRHHCVSVPRRHQLCVFCGAPGSRLCCDCDDLPALDYGQ